MPFHPSYEEADGYGEDDCADAEEDAEDDAFAGVEECGQVDGADDGEDSGQVEVCAVVEVGAVGPFADDPCGDEEQGEGLLELVAEEEPSCGGAEGPEQDGGGPVLLHVEDLADEGDCGSGGDCADGVHCGGEAGEVVVHEQAESVEEDEYGEDHDHADEG